MIWMWDEDGEFKGQTVMLWRAYAEVLAEVIEGWLYWNWLDEPLPGFWDDSEQWAAYVQEHREARMGTDERNR